MEENNLIFGIRAVMEALKAGKEIDKILIKKDLQGELAQELFAAVKGTNIFIQRVPIEKINRITRKNHQGVIAFISPVSYLRLENIVPTLYEEGKIPFIVLLDGLTDVRNFGAIARTCECAGVDAIVIPERGSVSVTPGRGVVASAGMSGTFHSRSVALSARLRSENRCSFGESVGTLHSPRLYRSCGSGNGCRRCGSFSADAPLLRDPGRFTSKGTNRFAQCVGGSRSDDIRGRAPAYGNGVRRETFVCRATGADFSGDLCEGIPMLFVWPICFCCCLCVAICLLWEEYRCRDQNSDITSFPSSQAAIFKTRRFQFWKPLFRTGSPLSGR